MFKKVMTAALIATLSVSSLAPAAMAGGHNHHHGNNAEWVQNGHGHHHGHRRHHGDRDWDDAHYRRHHHHDDFDVGDALLGAAAGAMITSAINNSY